MAFPAGMRLMPAGRVAMQTCTLPAQPSRRLDRSELDHIGLEYLYNEGDSESSLKSNILGAGASVDVDSTFNTVY